MTRMSGLRYPRPWLLLAASVAVTALAVPSASLAASHQAAVYQQACPEPLRNGDGHHIGRAAEIAEPALCEEACVRSVVHLNGIAKNLLQLLVEFDLPPGCVRRKENAVGALIYATGNAHADSVEQLASTR